jgi:hypothetical protein
MEDLVCNLDVFTSQCKIILSHMPVIAKGNEHYVQEDKLVEETYPDQ